MKKKRLKKAFEQLTNEFNELEEKHNRLTLDIGYLKSDLNRSKQLAEDYRIKLIKNTRLTLDEIDYLTEEEVFEKMERGYKGLSKELHAKIQPEARNHIITERMIQVTDEGEYIENPIYKSTPPELQPINRGTFNYDPEQEER